MPCYPPVESCKYVGKYFALFQLYLINQYSRWIKVNQGESSQTENIVYSATS